MRNDETAETYLSRLVDKEKLREYLATELGPADTFEVNRHPEGHSNETLFVTWDDKELVVRRPPPGETAETAHDVLREFRVMDALQETDVPVPPTVLACDDHDVLGSDFYVMELVDGDVPRDDEPIRFATPSARQDLSEEFIDTLAAIHMVDYEAVGLGDFGHPDGFTQRQVERWTKQFEWASDVTSEVREIPKVQEVGDWLVDNVPEESPETLVHGDYKLDNVIYGPETPPEALAVVDWELSTLGNPLTDLGWALAFWRDPKDPPTAVPELVPTFMEREGYLSRQDLVDRYERHTGLNFEHERFYRTLAVYKLIALGEMFFRRHREGNSDDPLYPLMEDRVPKIADRAHRIIDGAEPL